MAWEYINWEGNNEIFIVAKIFFGAFIRLCSRRLYIVRALSFSPPPSFS